MPIDGCLKSVLHGAGDGAFAIAPDGTIVVWNAAAERLLGYTEREAIGRPCCEVFGGYDGDGNRLCDRNCHVRALVRNHEPVHTFDMRTRTKAGRPLWLSTSVVALPRDGRDGAPYTVHFVRDVTATKELLTMVQERTATAATPPSAAGPAASELTRRELEILRLLMQGLNTATIVGRLHVTRATVRNHVQNIFAKLGVHSRLEAVAYATRHRLV